MKHFIRGFMEFIEMIGEVNLEGTLNFLGFLTGFSIAIFILSVIIGYSMGFFK